MKYIFQYVCKIMKGSEGPNRKSHLGGWGVKNPEKLRTKEVCNGGVACSLAADKATSSITKFLTSDTIYRRSLEYEKFVKCHVFHQFLHFRSIPRIDFTRYKALLAKESCN